MPPYIRLLEAPDIPRIVNAFKEIGWNKPTSLYQRYLAEQQRGERTVLVAFQRDTFCGYVTICWISHYPPFRAEHIPEIVDFNVLPPFRRQGIGTQLLDEAESRIEPRSPMAGIGVGLYADYGAAQRMYVKRGYVPDGRGVVYQDHTACPGESVKVDDDLVLYFTRNLVSQRA